MNHEFMEALDELEKDRGIDKDVLIDTIEQALLTAYKKNFGSAQNVRIDFNREKGDVKVYSQRRVVDESDLYDNFLEIELDEARQINPKYELGDILENEVTPKDFGRIAAQTAKQVVVQRIREAEREIIYNEFIEKEGELVTGEVARVSDNKKIVYVRLAKQVVVQRIREAEREIIYNEFIEKEGELVTGEVARVSDNKKIVYVRLGKIEASMPESEQIPGEHFKAGDKIKVYILEVKKTNKGPQIVVSRSHPGLVKRLFESEVPEIFQGIVQIKSVSREAGSRTKMAVHSIDEKIDPIGACVGPQGTRVKYVVDELGGEKIDIINYSENPAEYVSASLSPSKVVKVEVNEEEKSALVVVPDYQLSLAIGKAGQNARLAAKLTNWKIDIKSESQLDEE